MKKAFLLLLFAATAHGQMVVGTLTGTKCVSVDASTTGTAGISVQGSWSGTIQAQTVIGGDPAQNVSVYLDGTKQSTITASGTYTAPTSGATQFQVCGATVTGTANIKLYPAQQSMNLNGGGGGGGGGVTSFNTRTGDVVPALADYEALLLTSATLDADFNVTDADGNFIVGASTGIAIVGAHGGGFSTDVNGQLTIFGLSGQVVNFQSTGTWNSGATTIDGTDGHITVVKSVSAGTYQTASACASGASPAVCGSAAAGSVAVPTGANPTLVVDTTAVTANSQIFLQVDDSGTVTATTCDTNTTQLAFPHFITARTAATSFTITVAGTVTTHPLCMHYMIIN